MGVFGGELGTEVGYGTLFGVVNVNEASDDDGGDGGCCVTK